MFFELHVPHVVLTYYSIFPYDIVKGKIVPIDYANTGVLQISMVWSDGLAQMLQMKEGLLLEPENLSNNFISTAGFFKRYGTDIYGLTGTLGNNSTRSFFREVYDVDMATIPPYKKQSITCNEQSLYQCKELTAHISHTQPEWVEAIITSSVQKAKQGRAVLMLCQYIDQVKKLRDLFSKVYDTGKIFIYTGQEAFHKHHIDSGEIIIATNISGRGTDLKTSAKVEENGGMHVCLTFLPSSYRVELQNAGRTAREGKKGTAQLVLYHPDEAQTIEKLRQKRDEDETKRLEKAKHDVRDILFKDDLFTKFCALENEFFPPAAEQNKIDETHMLDAGWQQVLRTRLSPARSKELYEEAIKEKVNAILEPIMERLIKEKYVQKHDYLTRYKKFDEIITQLRKDNPEESIRKTHEEHVFNDFWVVALLEVTRFARKLKDRIFVFISNSNILHQ